MTNQEGAKVYHVTLSCTLCRGFWIQAHTPDEAADWADEHLKDQDHFSDQDPYFEVCDVYESSPDEAQKSFQPVLDASKDYKDKDSQRLPDKSGNIRRVSSMNTSELDRNVSDFEAQHNIDLDGADALVATLQEDAASAAPKVQS